MYGEQIKNARKEKGYTQAQAAKLTGIPQTTISWIEKDKGIANIHQCVLLAECYGISLDELIGKDNVN